MMKPSNYYHATCKKTISIDERNSLIEEHLPLVKFIAERVAVRLPFTIEINDLVSAGIFGLIDAIDKYDSSRNVKFKTYAELRIRGAILDSLRELDWVPRSLRRRAKEVEQVYSQLEQKFRRPPVEEEVAEVLGISISELQELLGQLRWLSVKDRSKSDNSKEEITYQLPDNRTLTPSLNYEQKETRELLASAIDRLPERERQVIALYYLEELTMKEIATVLSITESRVSQLHTQAIIRLRGSLSPSYAEKLTA